jgi:tripartite-type tricarboxylate transporter receptor subunit TctC
MIRFHTALRLACVSLIASIASQGAAQQAYPTRPIRFVTPFPPGGSTDPMGRFVAAKLTERLGQQVIVENRPGANTVGTNLVARATPDGHTMLYVGAAFYSTATLIPNLPFNTLRDLTAVGTMSKSRSVLVVHPSVPVQSLQELVALAKAKPGQINFGSSGHGTTAHFNGELLRLATSIDIRHIPYKGSGPLTTDLLAGRIEMAFQVPITVITFINAGKLRPLVHTGETRLAALSQVPTFSEIGMPGFGVNSISAIAVPSKTPRRVIDRLSTELAAIIEAPDTAEFMAKHGAEPFINNPDQTNAVFREEIARYAKVSKDAGISFKP